PRSPLSLHDALPISSRSTLVSRSSRSPLSASAWRTQPRRASLWMPRSFATCAIGRPVVRTSRTARSRSSSGYLRGAGTARGSPSGQDHKPGFRDSTKPGAAHVDGRLLLRPELVLATRDVACGEARHQAVGVCSHQVRDLGLLAEPCEILRALQAPEPGPSLARCVAVEGGDEVDEKLRHGGVLS